MHTLVDSHCHLDYPDFQADFDDTLARAHQAGVGTMLTICTEMANFPAVRRVAERENIYCTVGVHPHNADKDASVTADALLKLADDPKVVGFGETGLDYYYEHSNRSNQQAAFRQHIRAAQTAQLPVIIHTRDAEDDTLAILQEEYAAKTFPGLIHCFTASQAFAEEVLKLGFYISLSGILTFKKADDLRAAAAAVPLERLLIETDSPYLAPMPHRGKRNEPAFVAHVAETLASVKGVPVATIAETTTANFFRLFTKIPSA